MKRRTLMVGGTALTAVLTTGARAAAAPGAGRRGTPAAAARDVTATRDVAVRRWIGAAGFAAGTGQGTTVSGDALAIGQPVGSIDYTDPYGDGQSGRYEYATWTSPTVSPGFGLTQLVASWNASTPGGTWIEVSVRGDAAGTTTKWYVLGRWAADDTVLHRTSVGGQGDPHGDVDTDTFSTADGSTLGSWQLRVQLYRPAGGTQSPSVRSVGAMASALPDGLAPASTPGVAAGVTLDVPQYSQEIHSGQYPQWDGGGEAWCSPTSTSMLVAYWGTGPTPADYSWVDPSYADPWVDHAARNTFDHQYDGCGNWPFNTAYAGRFGLDAFVTRLRSMAEAEQFIAAGIPLAVSAAFQKGQIPGLDYGTNGHLMVVAGFAANGDLLLNDPFSPDDASVRKTVGRPEFEAAWLSSSGGTVYVVHPPSTLLPTPPGQPNW